MSEFFFAPECYDAGDFVIRCYQRGDGAAMQRTVIDSYDHLKTWMQWANQDQTVEESEANARRFMGSYLRNEDYTLGIWMGNEMVGGTGFHRRWGLPEWNIAEIGMWIAGKMAGKGFGTRVLAAMLDWGFTEWPWERIVWRCDTRNSGSSRVAEKNGLTREGTFRSDCIAVDGMRRDTHCYAILKEEWESRP
ncbi:MAG TPA: GNAT family protein [Fimbriimonadaceae bacterium]|jgi:RimJ/RimL family protein N-acetyltransferase